MLQGIISTSSRAIHRQSSQHSSCILLNRVVAIRSTVTRPSTRRLAPDSVLRPAILTSYFPAQAQKNVHDPDDSDKRSVCDVLRSRRVAAQQQSNAAVDHADENEDAAEEDVQRRDVAAFAFDLVDEVVRRSEEGLCPGHGEEDRTDDGVGIVADLYDSCQFIFFVNCV